MTSTDIAPARRVASSIEAVTGQVYFSPECHQNYADLGFEPSAREVKGVAMPDGPAYFCSRGSVMGQVPGEVVAAAFAVFDPVAVRAAVAHGWTLTEAETICAARTAGAVAQLERLLGPKPDGLGAVTGLLEQAVVGLRPEGRPLFAGIRSQDRPESDLGIMWWLADQLREFRGDCHTAAWISAGVDATEMGLLTELYWGMPARSYSRSRAWSDSAFDAAETRLLDRGLLAGEPGSLELSDAGRTFREEIEVVTDRGCQPIVDGLGDGLDQLVETMQGWSDTIRAGAGYPASGPHDLADSTSS